MIDLSKQTKTKAYAIKLPDSSILHIKNPTQSQLVKLVALQELIDNNQIADVLEQSFDIATKIFNRNYENRSFSRIDIENMLDVPLCIEVLSDYLEKTLSGLGE
jgi:hypothetical protein